MEISYKFKAFIEITFWSGNGNDPLRHDYRITLLWFSKIVSLLLIRSFTSDVQVIFLAWEFDFLNWFFKSVIKALFSVKNLMYVTIILKVPRSFFLSWVFTTKYFAFINNGRKKSKIIACLSMSDKVEIEILFVLFLWHLFPNTCSHVSCYKSHICMSLYVTRWQKLVENARLYFLSIPTFFEIFFTQKVGIFRILSWSVMYSSDKLCINYKFLKSQF